MGDGHVSNTVAFNAAKRVENMIATLLMTAMMAKQSSDAWDIKPNLTAGKKMVWSAKINATVSGMTHDASMQLVLTPGDKIEGGGQKLALAWEKIEFDGAPMDIPASYTLNVGADGVVRDKIGDDDDKIRRFASIYGFAYPAAPVKVGDKWTLDVTPATKDAAKISYTFEAKEVTKVGDIDALKVASTETEAGTDGIKNTGTWFIGHDGTILKFKLEVKNWVVPFAGPDLVDATITGDVAKSP